MAGVGDDVDAGGAESGDLVAAAGFAEVDDGGVRLIGDDFMSGEPNAVGESHGPHEVGFENLDAHDSIVGRGSRVGNIRTGEGLAL